MHQIASKDQRSGSHRLAATQLLCDGWLDGHFLSDASWEAACVRRGVDPKASGRAAELGLDRGYMIRREGVLQPVPSYVPRRFYADCDARLQGHTSWYPAEHFRRVTLPAEQYGRLYGALCVSLTDETALGRPFVGLGGDRLVGHLYRDGEMAGVLGGQAGGDWSSFPGIGALRRVADCAVSWHPEIGGRLARRFGAERLELRGSWEDASLAVLWWCLGADLPPGRLVAWLSGLSEISP